MDRGVGVPLLPRPGRLAAPVGQQPAAGLFQQINGALGGTPAAPQQSGDSGARALQLLLEEAAEDLPEETPLLCFGEDLEVGVHSRLDRAFPQDRGAEGVDRPDGRLFQLRERRFEPPAPLGAVPLPSLALYRRLEPLANPQPQLPGRLLREGNGCELPDLGRTGAQKLHYPVNHRGRLSGPGGRLHDESGVVVATNPVPSRRVGEAAGPRCAHGSLRTAATSPSAALCRSLSFVVTCVAGRGPQTGK